LWANRSSPSSFTAPRLICGAVYKHLDEKMKFLWGADLRLNTVHVNDVCKALWHVATKCPVGSIFNLADKGDTSTLAPPPSAPLAVGLGS
jgi:dTDP-D-glucose 4,6-dehydratase